MSLPPVYERWIQGLVGSAPPAEPRATCDACPMVPGAAGQLPGAPPFDARVKCCTYTPELPSFQVGAILADEDAPGRPSVEARLAAGAGVTPFGLGHAPGYRERHAALGPGMGRDLDYTCPHYQQGSGRCGIWRHRDAVCSTWFCRFERGAVGHQAWAGLKTLLQRIEEVVALWCADELGVELPQLLPLVEPRKDPPTSALRAARWGRWLGREREYFLACAERVEALGPEDVARIGGLPLEVQARATREAFASLTAEGVPERLTVGLHQTVAVGAEANVVVTYSPYDPLALPAALLGILHAFDGRPTQEVLAALAEERGVALDPAFLRQLVDWALLVRAPE